MKRKLKAIAAILLALVMFVSVAPARLSETVVESEDTHEIEKFRECNLSNIEEQNSSLSAKGIGASVTYDYVAAAQYGYDHAWDTPTYSGGDCANFTSHCLAAGGVEIINSSKYYSYNTPSYQNCSGALEDYRNPYIASAAQLLYLSEFYEVISNPSHSEIELGDIVFMQSGYPDGHVVIITGFNGTMPLYSAHTTARQNQPLYNLATFVVKMRRPLGSSPTPSGGVQDLTNPKNPNKYSTPPSGTYLNVGDSGTYVSWLQACLNQCGYSCDVDGQFGYGTAEALKSFQRAYSLTVDGGFGPECRTKIIAVLTVATPSISVANVENGKQVTITSGNGTTIFYTTNGSNPTESSTKYTGAFTLYGSATVKAVAMQNCRFNSDVKSTQVTIDRPGKPSINAVCVAQRVWIKWAPTANTHHYDVRIYPEGSQTEIICEYGVTNSYMAFELPAGKYYANVASCNQNGTVYTFSDSTAVFTVTNITDSSYQPAATVTSGSHRYVLYPDRMGSWQEAKEFCERQGGHLVTITSAAEQQTVQSLLQQYSSDASCWLGCKLMNDGSWMWVTGEALGYTNWRSGEPNNYGNDEGYGMVVGDYNGQWNDIAMTTGSYNLCVVLELELTYHTVTFKDWDGTVLKTQQVEHGKAATAPANPTRTGYTFTGWDKAFTNVTADLVVTAQYSANTYTVTFKDWDGTVLKTQQVQYGNAATAPANPTRTGYTFTGWDRTFTNVTADLVVTAQYSANTYTVTFKDWDGTVLKTQQVQYGSAATAPANPSREGYTFTGWDKAFNNVTSNLTVTAQYQVNEVDPNAVRFEIEKVRSQPGADVSVKLNIEGEYEAHTLTVYVFFDAEKLSLTSSGLTKGDIWMQMLMNSGTVLTDTTSVPGKIGLVAIMPADSFSGSGTLFTMNFHVADDVELETEIPITIQIVQFTNFPDGGEESPISHYIVNGGIEIPSFTFGDVNNDGLINASDAISIMRHALGTTLLTGTALLAADYNQDGVVNASDALRIMRVALGVN